MKTDPILSSRHPRGTRGFTMVEIAISLAVVAFALVAIMGVLPTGMTVEKENQEDTLINQEGNYWLEAIRSGSRGMADLTNYVESITITNATGVLMAVTNGQPNLLTPDLIVGLLTTPKFIRNPVTLDIPYTNRITAVVKAITGSAAEKGPLTNEFSFRYMLDVSITPDESLLGIQTNLYSQTLAQNLHDVRLVLRWPVYERAGGYAVGSSRKTFRAKVSGVLTNEIRGVGVNSLPVFYIKPNLYAHALP